MTDATPAEPVGRADGGAGSDSVHGACCPAGAAGDYDPEAHEFHGCEALGLAPSEWRVTVDAMGVAGFTQSFGLFDDRDEAEEEADGWRRATAGVADVIVVIQRRKVGPWEDVD